LFSEKLKLALELIASSDTFTIPAGAIEGFHVNLVTWGFTAEVSFRVNCELEDDPVYPAMTATAPIRAKLSIGRYRGPDEQVTPLVLGGYVVERSFEETTSEDLEGEPVVGRLYRLRIVDPARALWTRHFPVELYVNASMKEVVQAHLFGGIEVTYDFTKLDEKHDVLCVSTSPGSASFYDFVVWYIARHDGVLEFDPGTGRYRIGGEKKAGKAQPFDASCVQSVRVDLFEPHRHVTHVLNPHTEAATVNQKVDNEDVIRGVRRDVFAHTPISSRFDERVKLETARLRPSLDRVAIALQRFPDPAPTTAQLFQIGKGFSDKTHAHGKDYRLVRLTAAGRIAELPDDERDIEAEVAAFELDVNLRAEQKAEPHPTHPDHVAPPYPVFVEGKLLSSSGEDDDRTWTVIENESDSMHYQRIHVPLWDKTIIAPFLPNLLSGQFFFPPYKGQRVLVALDFTGASIRRFLDWAQNARLPNETQGNQLVMGYGAENGTIVRHLYRDDQPALRIERKLGDDIETIDVTEGTIRFEVREQSESE